jgi:FixJ family two-component response regulator
VRDSSPTLPLNRYAAGRGMSTGPLVFVIDDDDSVRKSLQRLLRASGYTTNAFASAEDFQRSRWGPDPCCAIVDVKLPGLNGLELQQALTRGDEKLPIIFITGHGDIPMSVKAMKAGAVDFLPKPFSADELLGAVRHALEISVSDASDHAKLIELRSRYARLTPRERDVMEGVVAGKLNKQIAAELGSGEKAVKVHRARVMQKMQARSLADLVRMASRLSLGPRGRRASDLMLSDAP